MPPILGESGAYLDATSVISTSRKCHADITREFAITFFRDQRLNSSYIMSNRSFRGVRTIHFSNFELDVRALELRKDGNRVRLQEQPLRILTALLERPGEVVTREEIRRRLWPNGTVVEVSHGINAAVQRLREALGESAENPQFVETLARRGYRFVAPVEIGLKTPSGPVVSETEARPPADVSHFHVLERLGAGGMGVVYRAEDRKLGRSVALKFLPDALAQDAGALARFRREAQAASALNHPNICTIYGVEECEGKPVIVMEYIEGESLEVALKRGPLPVEKAVSVAIQMAGALDAAHRAGIVHRDLKPSNVLIGARGVKVLDFGLAKMDRPPALGFEPPHLTNEGAILGTLHYLSPEQAQGQPTGPRSDIFSLGVVLYEMLAGRRAFDGPNAAKVMAAILALEHPPLDQAIPRGLDFAIRRCLAKDPEERWQSARDLKASLEGLSTAREAPPAAETPLPKWRLWAAAAALVVLATVLVVSLPRTWRGAAQAPLPRNQVTERMPATVGIAVPAALPSPSHAKASARAVRTEKLLQLAGGTVTRLALSPDGRRIAYLAGGLLWIAGINGEAAAVYGPAVGTPFWSPDGRFVAVTGSNHNLVRFDVAIRGSSNLCTVDTNFSGAWNGDGTIIIGLIRDGIFRVPGNGGLLERVTSLDAARSETRHVALQFLPGGRRFLFVAGSKPGGSGMLYAGSLDSAERIPIMPVSSNAQYAAGYLAYLENSALMARPFDPNTLRLSGEPFFVGVAPPAETAANASLSFGKFSIAGDILAIAPAKDRTSVTLVKNWAMQ